MEIKNKNLFFGAGLLGLAFFIADRIFKNLVLAGRIFGLKNYGLALSIDFGGIFFEIIFWLLAVAVIFLLAFLLLSAIKKNSRLLFVVSCLLLAGSASNLLDRLKFGYVIDYINFHFFYNNLADIAIWLGIVIYLISVYNNKQLSS